MLTSFIGSGHAAYLVGVHDLAEVFELLLDLLDVGDELVDDLRPRLCGKVE